MHTRDVTYVLQYEPVLHAEQLVDMDRLVALEKVPAGHGVGVMVFKPQYLPDGHGRGSVMFDVGQYEPAGH